MKFVLVFVALLLAACSTVAPKPEVSDVLYSVTFPDEGDGSDSMVLHSTVGACARYNQNGLETRRTTYHYRKVVKKNPQLGGTTIEGCYFINEGVVFYAFDDGDSGMLKLEIFVKPGEPQKPLAKRGERSA
jgi:hypothetical protein